MRYGSKEKLFFTNEIDNCVPKIEPSSTSPTAPMTTQATVIHNGSKVNGHMMPGRAEGTMKPLLHSILQTDSAAPFTKKPSVAYQIEYNSNIYNPEAINSMASSSSYATTFTPTKPTLRPMSMKTTIKTYTASLPSTLEESTQDQEKQVLYVQPEIHAVWPVYNLIIEGHSKVKTYGLKNDDKVGKNLPNIRPIQPKENPIVKSVTNLYEGPKFRVKQSNQKTLNEFLGKNSKSDKKSAMTSLFSLLDSSFGNFLSDENIDKVRHESETKIVENEKENSEKRKRSLSEEEKRWRTSF